MSASIAGHRIAPSLKDMVWYELSATRPKPPMMTPRRLEKVKKRLWDDKEFWADLLDRHGLRDKSVRELDAGVREHAVANFWGMVCGEFVKSRCLSVTGSDGKQEVQPLENSVPPCLRGSEKGGEP